MTPTLKRILRTLGTVLGWILLLLLIGIPLSFLLFLALLSGLVPLYVLLPLLSVAAAGILAALLRRWCRPGPRGRHGITAAFALVCLGAAAWMGWGAYCAQLPTLDDRTLLLQDYQPFAPDSRAAVLPEPATLQWDEVTARHLRLDGATALYPVYAAFVQAVWPEGEYPLYASGSDSPYAGLIACTNTVNAYERLMRRETDLIFAAAPSADQLAQAEALGMTLHLTPIGREYGLVQDGRWAKYQHTQNILEAERRRLHDAHLRTADLQAAMTAAGLAPAAEGGIAEELLRRPEIHYDLVAGVIGWGEGITPMLAERLETEIKYAGYIARQDRMIREVARHEKTLLPEDFEYADLTGLTLEAREKLARIRPKNLGQASRIPGVSPSDVAQLSIALAAHT